MKKRTSIRSAGLAIMPVVLITLVLAQPLKARMTLSIMGRANWFQASGSSSDYKPGENDFALTSSHQNSAMALGLKWGRTFFFGVETHLNFAGQATLTDPSDQDTVKISTYANLQALLTGGFFFYRSPRFGFNIQAGGGITYPLNPGNKAYTSRLGYEVVIQSPKQKIGLTALAGLGLEIFFSRVAGLILGGRFQYTLFDEAQTAIVVLAGLIFRF